MGGARAWFKNYKSKMALQGDHSKTQALVAGVATFVIGETLSAPLVRIKLLLQCQGEIIKNGRLAGPYKGAADCARTVYCNEGLLSFWRGNLTGCLMFFSHPIGIVLREKLKSALENSADTHTVAFCKNLVSGVLASGASLLLLYSISYARVRLANDVLVTREGETPSRQFNGLIDVYRQTLKSDGISGLYRGFVVSLVGIIVYRGIYFALFDTLKSILLSKDGSEPLFFRYFLGFGVVLISGLISYPFDTIRSRMVMNSCELVKYKGWLDCGSQIIRNEGFVSLYNGVGISIVRGIIGASMLILHGILGRYLSS